MTLIELFIWLLAVAATTAVGGVLGGPTGAALGAWAPPVAVLAWLVRETRMPPEPIPDAEHAARWRLTLRERCAEAWMDETARFAAIIGLVFGLPGAFALAFADAPLRAAPAWLVSATLAGALPLGLALGYPLVRAARSLLRAERAMSWNGTGIAVTGPARWTASRAGLRLRAWRDLVVVSSERGGTLAVPRDIAARAGLADDGVNERRD